jgi:hypothetical protein
MFDQCRRFKKFVDPHPIMTLFCKITLSLHSVFILILSLGLPPGNFLANPPPRFRQIDTSFKGAVSANFSLCRGGWTRL